MRLLAPTLIALLLGCASVRVSVDFDPEEDFSAFRTYAWVPVPQERTGDFRIDNPFLDKRIRAAVDANLAAKGFARQDDELPDFYVAYHLSIDEKIDVYTINRFYYDYYWAYSVPETRVRQYDEGTLVIDVANARRKDLVWRGVGQGRVPQRSTPEATSEGVNEAVAEILKSFPPSPETR